MIIRTWRGHSSAANRAMYPEHFRSGVLPELRTVSGFLGARLLESPDHDGFEFLVMTRWHSLDAIRAFAGDDPERPAVATGPERFGSAR